MCVYQVWLFHRTRGVIARGSFSLSVRRVGLEPEELHKLALIRAVLHDAELDALAEFLPEVDVRVLLNTGRQRIQYTKGKSAVHDKQ